MEIRRYKKGEEAQIWNLFLNTVQHVNSNDYSIAQINAWASEDITADVWLGKIQAIAPYVAVYRDEIIGYADLQNSGYIEHFFCHHQHQRTGVGSALFSYIEAKARKLGIIEMSADVSITAKPFFESKGFVAIKQQLVSQKGQELINFKMVRKYDHS